MNSEITLNDLFDRRIAYPDVDAQTRLSRLVGLDDYKERLTKILGILVNPAGLEEWANAKHKNAELILDYVLRRPPLIVLAGDVGSGKTELAESIGDSVARQENIGLTLFPLSLSTRGQGRVGEMTKLLSSAFDQTISEAKKFKKESGQSRGAIILLVDEADALAQSREMNQMHHEDKAGVNAFVRGIDQIGNSQLPAAVIMCTNRLGALDPAIRRRAADILTFSRPGEKQRFSVLSPSLKEVGLTDDSIEIVVKVTGKREENGYGFTYSDLTQRLLPTIVLDAYPSKRITPERVIEIAQKMDPTPPFQEKSG